MIVNENPRRAEHIISGSGPLAYNFPIMAAADLLVIQDGVVLDPIQYQVTGVGQDGGGTVILATGPADGTQVVILGDQPYKQTSVYTTEAFPPQRLQNDFNKVVIMIQQLVEILNRTPRFSSSSQLDIPDIPEPTAVDQFLKTVSVDPLAIGWGTLAVLEGAVGIPLSPANGGTGASYASEAAILQGLGAARWGSADVTPSTDLLSLANPLASNRILVGSGPFAALSTSGIAPGTTLVLEYLVGGNQLTDNSLMQLQGRVNYLSAVGDRSVFFFSGTAWYELARIPAPSVGNALKYQRGDGTYQTISTLAPKGVSSGLTVSNNATDAINDVDISAGDAFSDEVDPLLRLQLYSPTTFVKQLDNEWVAGTGNGGRVSGQALTNGTWHIFMFRRIGGSIDFCFSNNLVFVTPDGGTNRVCIMSVIRESGSISGFRQEGDWVAWNTPAINLDMNPPGIVAIPVPMRSPNGMKCMVRYTAQLRTGGSGIAVVALFSDLATADNAPALDVAPLYNVGLVNSNHVTTVRQLDTMSDLNTSIRARCHASDSGTRLRVVTEGFFHPRGRR